MIDDFDSEFYLNFYPHLKDKFVDNPSKAYDHYLNIGKNKGFISNKKLSLKLNGYSSMGEIDDNSTIPSLTLDEIKKKYNIKDFNTLIIDCEGCFEMFLDENPTILNTINKIMFEHDEPHKCNYQKITQLLINNNFKLIKRSETAVVHEVWKK